MALFTKNDLINRANAEVKKTSIQNLQEQL